MDKISLRRGVYVRVSDETFERIEKIRITLGLRSWSAACSFILNEGLKKYKDGEAKKL